MKKILFSFLFLITCLSLYAQRRDPSALSYIEQYKDLAIQEMKLTGIPASITLAQALHESANGTSQLAVNANNHFGVKCTANWSGKRYYRNNNTRNNCFRHYESAEDAYKDRSRFLSSNKKYAFLFEYGPGEYKKWAHGLQRSGYASNKHYASHLIKAIRLYDLHQYDTGEDAETETDDIAMDGDTVATIDIQTVRQQRTPEKQQVIHKVKSGESLYMIARKYKTDVKHLKLNNRLHSNLIKPGQKLIIR